MNNRRREVNKTFNLLINEIDKDRLNINTYLEIFKNWMSRNQLKFKVGSRKNFVNINIPKVKVKQLKEINIETVSPDFKHIDLRNKENENGIK